MKPKKQKIRVFEKTGSAKSVQNIPEPLHLSKYGKDETIVYNDKIWTPKDTVFLRP